MLFINDVIRNVNSDFNNIFNIDELQIFMLLYAEDAVVFARSPEVLESILNDIESYCTNWELKINTVKTKSMLFEKGRHKRFDFYLKNHKIRHRHFF